MLELAYAVALELTTLTFGFFAASSMEPCVQPDAVAERCACCEYVPREHGGVGSPSE